MSFIINRLKEPSTWYAILWTASVFGSDYFDPSPEQKEALVNLATIVFGGAAIITPERTRGRPKRGAK